MKVVLTLAPGGEPEVVEAQVGFHLAVGVDLVLVAEPVGEARSALGRHEREGRVQLFPARTGETADGSASALSRLAQERGATWLIECGPGEFWWPRWESIGAVLAAIPDRYTTVQALVRELVAVEASGHWLVGRTVLRRALRPDGSRPPGEVLRPIRRPGSGWPVPLRGWYPVEVLRLPSQDAAPLDESERSRGLEDGSLVEDARLRDALEALARGEEPRLPLPGVVDDALYAAECAAVGEVTAESLERRVEELEAQLARLERRLWTRVNRRLSRLTARRPG